MDSEVSDGDHCSSPLALLRMHTVTFKYIGSNHDANAHIPEPNNPIDVKFFAFQCKIENNEWHRIGFIVRESLDAVHTAIEEQTINEDGEINVLLELLKPEDLKDFSETVLLVSIKLAWAKYIVKWTQSRPAFFAGINITIKGQWPVEVCHCGSTC